VAEVDEHAVAQNVFPPEVWREVAEDRRIGVPDVNDFILGDVEPYDLRNCSWVACPSR